MADLPLHSHSPSSGNPGCVVSQEKALCDVRMKPRLQAAPDMSLTAVDHISFAVIPAPAQLPIVKALGVSLCGRSEAAHCRRGWLVFSMRPAHMYKQLLGMY